MRKIIYHIILVVIIMLALFTTTIFMSEVVQYTGVGTKGIVAGIGIFIYYKRKAIFKTLDKLTGRKPDPAEQINE